MKKPIKAVVFATFLLASTFGFAASASAAGDGYCGHGVHGWINQHHFVQHHYWAPTFDGHDHYNAFSEQWTYGYSYCGH